MKSRFHAVSAVVATLVVGAAVAWGFVLVGSPATRRLERFDEQRLQDLQTIAREIQRLCVDNVDGKETLKKPLPQTLEEVARRAEYEQIALQDPETGEPYRYTVKNENTYELCATFSLEHDADIDVFWNHPAGKHCFTIDVLDPPPIDGVLYRSW